MATLSVTNNTFTTRTPSTLTVGSVNADPVVFVVDESWDGLTVFAAFRNDTEGVERHVLLGDDLTCTIPWECLTQPGTLNVGLLGLRGSDVVKPTIWMQFGRVVQGVNIEGEAPGEPTETALQQVVQIAQSVRTDADNGEFTPSLSVGTVDTLEPDQPATVTMTGTQKDPVLNFGIPRGQGGGGTGGTTDYTKLTNKPKINGVELLGNKTAQELNLQPKGDYAAKTDIPEKLPAPYTLTFAGAVEAAYDGSKAVTVTIPTIAGPPGVSPTVSTDEIDGGTRVTFTFKGGSETVDILNGKTPVKGTDYFTEAEKKEIAEQAAALVPGGVEISGLQEVFSLVTDEEVGSFEITQTDEGVPLSTTRFMIQISEYTASIKDKVTGKLLIKTLFNTSTVPITIRTSSFGNSKLMAFTVPDVKQGWVFGSKPMFFVDANGNVQSAMLTGVGINRITGISVIPDDESFLYSVGTKVKVWADK